MNPVGHWPFKKVAEIANEPFSENGRLFEESPQAATMDRAAAEKNESKENGDDGIAVAGGGVEKPKAGIA